MEGGNRGSPTGILSVSVETKTVDGIEVVRLIKTTLTDRSTKLMMLNDQATKSQVKFNSIECKLTKKRKKTLPIQTLC